ncbi:hypothetical protein [Azospirillum halopraeferens]|uniref:hypothetical protein n=1 Tax=Azospirillum halopraeferens TaxID=34010 RepID=UPI001B3BF662|nr:hypothetical protein [Azospirillum halopraeferens]
MRLVLFAVLLALAGCGPVIETQYTLIPPSSPEGRMCVAQCQQTTQYCRQSCRLEKQTCVADQRSRAMMDYQQYVNERTAKKEPIKRTPSSFEQTWRCNDSGCDGACQSDFRTCFATCGGQVIPRQVCTAFCS